MGFSRREFLKRLGAAAGTLPAASALSGCGDDTTTQRAPLAQYEWSGDPGPATLFGHGVASGDPLADSVILWTRVTPADFGEVVEVYWEIAEDPDFARRVGAGWFHTHPRRDYTVKTDVTGLDAGRTYYYRFRSQGRTSPVGRTRTAPEGGVEQLRFGVVSCSNFANGFFHVYKQLAARADLDAVLHLGDYIYEYAGGEPSLPGADGKMVSRAHLPRKEITTLKDYRVRHAQYRTDPDLQEVHRQHPFIVVWDDHEVANNSWSGGAQNHNEGEGDWALRRWAARKAYFEWMPIRELDGQRLWRRFTYGDLLDVVMLDTRLWGRQEQVTDRGLAQDEMRTILGDDQEAWLADTLTESMTTWRMLGQQVMMAQLLIADAALNLDQWDGYVASRERLFDLVEQGATDNLIVLTGDIHTSWANELVRDPTGEAYDPDTSTGALGAEFVTPGVTSSGLGGSSDFIDQTIQRFNPHIKWYDIAKRGYLVMDITPERVQGAWFHLDRVDLPEFEESFAAAYSMRAGMPGLTADEEPAAPKSIAPELAPTQQEV